MAKSKKKPQGKKAKRATKKEKLKQLKSVLAEANAQADPLGALPDAFLSVSLGGAPTDDSGESNNDKPSRENGVASIRHLASPLPPAIHKQCLQLFETNMGDLYKRSEWGLDMAKKEEELSHPSARFLVVLSHNGVEKDEVATVSNDEAEDNDAKDNDATEEQPTETISKCEDTFDGCTVLGFAHFRHEADDDDDPQHPVTYLYELQIHPSYQKHGLGKRLMSIVELVALKLKMAKVMLTVFHANEGAMKFYRKRKYEVDESSPSNFEGGEGCEYEILCKPLGGDAAE
ncbi:hypothetical protein ACHAXT_010525 [Thalassiosira profunda]